LAAASADPAMPAPLGLPNLHPLLPPHGSPAQPKHPPPHCLRRRHHRHRSHPQRLPQPRSSQSPPPPPPTPGLRRHRPHPRFPRKLSSLGLPSVHRCAPSPHGASVAARASQDARFFFASRSRAAAPWHWTRWY
jgi:hypothetical protein